MQNKVSFYSHAVREALDDEMAADEKVVLLGEDIGIYGGAFKVTEGLLEKYGKERVIDTPICENSIVGMAAGAAMAGLRPVVEIMFMDFIALALDPLLNTAGKAFYMYNEQITVPMVVRTPGGAKGGYGPSHSQMLTNFLCGIPGVKVIATSNSSDVYHLLRQSIQDPNPVVFVENKKLYPQRSVIDYDNDIILGEGRVVIPGEDCTLFAYSAMVPLCMQIAKAYEKQGVALEVVDLISLNPLDTNIIRESMERTGKAIIVEEACFTGGVGAEVAAWIAANMMDVLEAPVLRVAAADIPVPASMELEKHVLPGAADINEAIQKVLSW